jgi:hypothetical protein
MYHGRLSVEIMLVKTLPPRKPPVRLVVAPELCRAAMAADMGSVEL